MTCNREYFNTLILPDGTFDRSKKYFEVMQLSGDVRQSREDNEEQAILRDLLQRASEGFWADGSVVKGCGLTRDTVAKTATVQPGWVYAQGIVHETAGSEAISIPDLGNFYIGFRIKRTIVTHQDAAELRDPAVGVANEGLPGAERLKLEVEWVSGTYTDCDDVTTVSSGTVDGVYPAFKFQDGLWLSAHSELEVEGHLATALEARFSEALGDFVVNGLNVIPDDTVIENAGEKTTLFFEPGVAALAGRFYRMPDKRKLVVDLSPAGLAGSSHADKDGIKTIGSRLNVPYVAGGSAINIGSATPTRVTLSVQVTEKVKHGNLDGRGIFSMDQLLGDLATEGYTVSRILSVTGADATVYTEVNGQQGDFRLIVGTVPDPDDVTGTQTIPASFIDWTPNFPDSREPSRVAGGAGEYTVVMVYEKVLDPSEYTVVPGGATITASLDTDPVGKLSAFQPYAAGYWNLTFQQVRIGFDVFLTGDCDGELIFGLHTLMGDRPALEWKQPNGTWVVTEQIPGALKLAGVEVTSVVSEGSTVYRATVTPEDHLRVTQQQMRGMFNRHTELERLVLDLMIHGLRTSSTVDLLADGDEGYDPYAPLPKTKKDKAYDLRSATTEFFYHPDGRLKEEHVTGRDAYGRAIYSALTVVDSNPDTGSVDQTYVSYAILR